MCGLPPAGFVFGVKFALQFSAEGVQILDSLGVEL